MASLTKPVISVAVHILIEKGLLDLDTPIGQYLPFFKNHPFQVFKDLDENGKICL